MKTIICIILLLFLGGKAGAQGLTRVYDPPSGGVGLRLQAGNYGYGILAFDPGSGLEILLAFDPSTVQGRTDMAIPITPLRSIAGSRRFLWGGALALGVHLPPAADAFGPMVAYVGPQIGVFYPGTGRFSARAALRPVTLEWAAAQGLSKPGASLALTGEWRPFRAPMALSATLTGRILGLRGAESAINGGVVVQL